MSSQPFAIDPSSRVYVGLMRDVDACNNKFKLRHHLEMNISQHSRCRNTCWCKKNANSIHQYDTCAKLALRLSVQSGLFFYVSAPLNEWTLLARKFVSVPGKMRGPVWDFVDAHSRAAAFRRPHLNPELLKFRFQQGWRLACPTASRCQVAP